MRNKIHYEISKMKHSKAFKVLLHYFAETNWQIVDIYGPSEEEDIIQTLENLPMSEDIKIVYDILKEVDYERGYVNEIQMRTHHWSLNEENGNPHYQVLLECCEKRYDPTRFIGELWLSHVGVKYDDNINMLKITNNNKFYY